MRIEIYAAVALLTGCGGALGHRPKDYDEVAGELRRTDRARATVADDGLALFAGATVLERRPLIEAVLARNPSIEAARQGWHAAVAEAGGAGSLDDPMLSYEMAPLSIPGDMRFGQSVRLSQRLPFPGKRGLAADVAAYEAEAMRGDYRAAQLAIAAMASDLYDDYFVVARAQEINAHHRGLLEQMKQTAEARLAAGRGSTQDSLQAEVELGHLEQDELALEAERRAIVASLDGLLHRAADAALPPPPSELPPPVEPRDEPEATALDRRPEPAAARARIRASDAAIALAKREAYPDLELMTSYSTMWGAPEHRWMIGVALNLPIWRDRRNADVDAARARRARAEAELDRAGDDVRVEVTRAALEARESFHVVHLYAEKLIPAARDELDAALAGLVTDQNDFSTVIAADREVRDIELAAHRERAQLSRRMTALDRAAGRIPGIEDQGGAP